MSATLSEELLKQRGKLGMRRNNNQSEAIRAPIPEQPMQRNNNNKKKRVLSKQQSVLTGDNDNNNFDGKANDEKQTLMQRIFNELGLSADEVVRPTIKQLAKDRAYDLQHDKSAFAVVRGFEPIQNDVLDEFWEVYISILILSSS